MAYQFGSRTLRSSRGQTSTPGESGPGSNLNFLNALSSQFRGASGRYTRTPEYKSLMLRDPRSTTVNQQRGVSTGDSKAYSPLTTAPPAVPGNQGGSGIATGILGPSITGGFNALTGAVHGELGSAFSSQAAKGGLQALSALAPAVQQGILSPQQAMTLAPQVAIQSFVNPLSILGTFASTAGTAASAADAAEVGQQVSESSQNPLTAELAAYQQFAQAPKGLSSLGQHVLGLLGLGPYGVSEAEFSAPPPAHVANLAQNAPQSLSESLSEVQARSATQAANQELQTSIVDELLSSGQTPAQVAAALNASMGGDPGDIGFGFVGDLQGVAPGITQGDPNAFGQVSVTGTSPGMLAALAQEGVNIGQQSAGSGQGLGQAGTGQGLGQAGVSAPNLGLIAGGLTGSEAEAIGQAEAEFGGQSPGSGGGGGDGGGTVLCTAMNDMGYMNREEKLMAHKYRMSHDLNMVRGYQKLFLPIARAMRKGRFVFMIMKPLVTRWHQNMVDKLAGRDVTYKWIDKIESFLKPICKRAGERKWRIDPILK